MSRAGHPRGRRRDLRQPARDRARHSWGDGPTWKVPAGEKGKGFLLYRMPHKTAVDPETGEMYDDLLVIITPTEVEKRRWSRTPRRRSSRSTTSATSTRCWSSSPGSASWSATSWPRSSPTPGPRGRRSGWCASTSAMADPRRPHRAGPARAASRRTAGRPSTRPGWRRTTCSRRSGSTTPTPTWCCRRCCAQHGLSGRDAAFATELVVGHAPPAGHLRRRARRLRGPAAGEGRGQGARRAAAGRPPAALDAGAEPRRDQHDRRPGPGPGRPGAGRLRQRRAAPGRPSTTSPGGSPGRTRPGQRPGRLRLGRAQPSRAGSWRSCPGRSATDELDALLAADNEPPRVVLVARPGPVDAATSCPARAPCSRRTAWCWRAATPARSPRRRRGPGGRAGRGLAAGRAGAGPRAGRGRGRALARPLRRPGGKAALLAALAAERGADLLAAERQPHRAAPGPAGAAPGPTASRAWSLPTAPAPPWPAGVLRPGAGRRALLGPGRAAPPAGVALAAHAPTTSTSWCRCSARCSASALDSVRPGGVVLYATCSPVLAETAGRGDRRRSSRADDVVLEDAAALLPEVQSADGPDSEHPATLAAPAPDRRDVPDFVTPVHAPSG